MVILIKHNICAISATGATLLRFNVAGKTGRLKSMLFLPAMHLFATIHPPKLYINTKA
jgi:hypothetical protein